MSLRDQLLAKGLVSGKRARRIDQEQRQERKQCQGHKRRKKELQAQRAAAEQAEREAREESRRKARAEYAEQRARTERALQIRQTILGNLVRSRGGVIFHHRGLDGRTIHRMLVSSGLAHQLRCGDAAVVALHGGAGVEYVAVTRRAADKLDEIAPHLVVFRVRDTEGLGAADLAFVARDWDPSLSARRATDDDLRRLGAAGVPTRLV